MSVSSFEEGLARHQALQTAQTSSQPQKKSFLWAMVTLVKVTEEEPEILAYLKGIPLDEIVKTNDLFGTNMQRANTQNLLKTWKKIAQSLEPGTNQFFTGKGNKLKSGLAILIQRNRTDDEQPVNTVDIDSISDLF